MSIISAITPDRAGVGLSLKSVPAELGLIRAMRCSCWCRHKSGWPGRRKWCDQPQCQPAVNGADSGQAKDVPLITPIRNGMHFVCDVHFVAFPNKYDAHCIKMELGPAKEQHPIAAGA